MWNDTDDRIMNILDSIEVKANAKFPTNCPICGQKGGHIYFHKFEVDDNKGGVWVWCSNCHYSTHAMVNVPKWWINLKGISIQDLSYFPDYLEMQKNKIDKWVNKLRSLKY